MALDSHPLKAQIEAANPKSHRDQYRVAHDSVSIVRSKFSNSAFVLCHGSHADRCNHMVTGMQEPAYLTLIVSGMVCFCYSVLILGIGSGLLSLLEEMRLLPEEQMFGAS